MTMKLSEKGFNKIVNNLLHLRKLEFKPDDFEGGCCQNGKSHVVLTIEEAEAVTHMLKGDLDFYHYKTGQIHYPTVKLIEMMENRLKQAEKNDGRE